MNDPCSSCSITGSIEAARSFVEARREILGNKADRQLGAIAVKDEIHRRILKDVDCPSAGRQEFVPECPLTGRVITAMNMATADWPVHQWIAKFELLTRTDAEPQPPGYM